MRRLTVATVLLLLVGIAAADSTFSPAQASRLQNSFLYKFLARAFSGLEASANEAPGGQAAQWLPQNDVPGRSITIMNNASMCTMFWEEVSAAMSQMTSVDACGAPGRDTLLSGVNASLFCEVDTAAISTGTKCGTDSFLALTRPIYHKYKGTINHECVPPANSSLSQFNTVDMLQGFAFAGVQCLKDASDNYCYPMQMISSLPTLSAMSLAMHTEASLDAHCSGCSAIGIRGLTSIADELLDASAVTMANLTYALETIQKPCSEKVAFGEYCMVGSGEANPLSEVGAMNCTGSLRECAVERRAALAAACDMPCVKSALKAQAPAMLSTMCSRAGNGDRCYNKYMQFIADIAIPLGNEGPPMLYDLMGMMCGGEMRGEAQQCTETCRNALHYVNGKLGCCADSLINTLSSSQQAEVFHASNMCGVQMMPACEAEYQAVEFSVTVNHVHPAWIASNEIEVSNLISKDLALMTGLDPMMFGATGYMQGTSKFKMTALFADGFGDDAGASTLASAFKSRLEANTMFKLPMLSNKIPAHAVLGGAMHLVFDCTVSEISAPSNIEGAGQSKPVMAMMKIDSLNVAAFEANNGAVQNQLRMALAKLAMVNPTKVWVTGYADSGGLVVNVTAVAPNIAHVYRVMGALSHKGLIDSALTMEGLAATSMVGMAMSGPAPKLPLKLLDFCEMRPVSMDLSGSMLKLGVVHCFTETDLYLKSTDYPTLPPLPSHLNKTEVQEALKASTMPAHLQSQRNWAAVLANQDDPFSKLPQYVFQWTGNFMLSCGPMSMPQTTGHDAPFAMTYTLSPVRNPVGDLWQAFGASKYPQEKMPNTIAFAFAIDEWAGEPGAVPLVPTLPSDLAHECIEHGMLKVVVDQSSMPGPWVFTDKEGNQPYHFAEVEVRPRELSCDLDEFEGFASARVPHLVRQLKTASSMRVANSAMMTLTTIVNDESWVGCKQRIDNLYTTGELQASISGIRACDDPSDAMDPCCHEALRWSDCCLPSTKTVNISGVLDSVDAQAVSEGCGDNAALVTALLEDEFAEVLIATEVPEFGCNSKAKGVLEDKYWDRLMKPMWECPMMVFSGLSVIGKSTCNDDSECWSQSCKSDQNRCASAQGGAAMEPMLRCIVTNADSFLWERLAILIDVDPSKVNKDRPMKGAHWVEAVTNFGDRVGVPSCSGHESDMWCVIDVPEATCKMYTDWEAGSQTLQWIADPAGGGYCKRRWSMPGLDDLDDDQALQQCTQAFANPGFVCDKQEAMGSTPQACQASGGTPLTTSGLTVSVHRLRTSGILDWDDNGNPVSTTLMGDEAKCTMQKVCNWDRDGMLTGGDLSKCLTAENLQMGGQNVTIPTASFVDSSNPNKKMACLQCWGDWCYPWYAATPAICAVVPWRGSDEQWCTTNSGGGPDGLPAASFVSGMTGIGGHMMCRRDSLDSIDTCLDTRVCPVPEKTKWQQEGDTWTYNCAESLCIHMSATKEECEQSFYAGPPSNLTMFGAWRPKWKQGSGLCHVYGAMDDTWNWHSLDSKSTCEGVGAGLVWWEGRAFAPGAFNTAETCDSYCDNGNWPPPSECGDDSAQCDTNCPQCLPDNEMENMGGVCVWHGAVSAEQCGQNETDGYSWNYGAGLCVWEGEDDEVDEASCLARPMHSFHTCVGAEEDNCQAYCWAKDFEDFTSCTAQEDRDWDWEMQICKWYPHAVNRDTSPRCDTAQSMESCSIISTNCHWDGRNCSGTTKACDAMPGNNEWVGPSGLAGAAVSNSLNCRWKIWARCPDQTSCESAGECSDWWAEGGACVVPREKDEYGYARECWEVAKDDISGHEGYEWAAGGASCIVRKLKDGMTVRVEKHECSNLTYPGARWAERAQTQAECDAHGSVCRDTYDEWDIRGGMNKSVCEDKCNLQMSKTSHFRTGKWEPAQESPLHWVERSFGSVNSWDPKTLSISDFQTFVIRGIARLVASQLESQILCKLDAWSGWVPLLGELCGEQEAEGGGRTEVVFALDADTLACGTLVKSKPKITFHGSYTPGEGSSCAAGGTSVDAKFNKVVPVGADARRLLLASNRRDLADCTAHRVVKNANGAIVGQKMGAGLSVTGLNNVQICVNPTVTQMCSEYTVMDFVELSGSTYGLPLEVAVTKNAQGHYCFSGANSGKTYVPVHLDPNWKTMTLPATPTPTTPAVTPAPDTTTTPAPTPTVPIISFPVGGDSVTLSGETDITLPGGTTTIRVDAGSESVTASVLNATAGEEAKVQMVLSSGTTVNIPLSAMGANQKVQLRAANASDVAAASPLPSGSKAVSEALSIVLTPPLQVNLSFTVVGMVAGRRQDTVHHVHWLDKGENEWKPLCTEHTKASTTLTAPVTTDVQEDEGFNPSSGCASGVTPCDGSGGTLLAFELEDEPDCDSGGGGLSVGAIVGIVIGALGGVGLIGGIAFFGQKYLKGDDDRAALYQSTSPSLAAALGETPKREGEPEAAV
mmetsp:Transcript_32526/g.79354  ORF Transcript_32526/g.79354 Transcript_32526/m.79354 type:complete len:2453 (-) Transcript_32526:242-7600(-)